MATGSQSDTSLWLHNKLGKYDFLEKGDLHYCQQILTKDFPICQRSLFIKIGLTLTLYIAMTLVLSYLGLVTKFSFIRTCRISISAHLLLIFARFSTTYVSRFCTKFSYRFFSFTRTRRKLKLGKN